MMSTPKPLHDTSADRSTKVMGLALRDVNESLAGSLGNMASAIKMGAEKSFTSHSARIKEFLTRGIGGGGQLWETRGASNLRS